MPTTTFEKHVWAEIDLDALRSNFRAVKERAGGLPLETKALRRADDPLIALDVAAQDLWSLGCKNPALRMAGRDFSTAPVIV